MILTLDNFSYGVINSVLHHSFVYPIDYVKEKTGYSEEYYKDLYFKYSADKPTNVEKSDIDAILKGFELLCIELNDNDFYNLIDINKNQALKLSKLLEAAKKDKKLVLITKDLWE